MPAKRGESKKLWTSSTARLKSAASSLAVGGVRRSGCGEGKEEVEATFVVSRSEEGSERGVGVVDMLREDERAARVGALRAAAAVVGRLDAAVVAARVERAK